MGQRRNTDGGIFEGKATTEGLSVCFLRKCGLILVTQKLAVAYGAISP